MENLRARINKVGIDLSRIRSFLLVPPFGKVFLGLVLFVPIFLLNQKTGYTSDDYSYHFFTKAIYQVNIPKKLIIFGILSTLNTIIIVHGMVDMLRTLSFSFLCSTISFYLTF